MTAAMVASSARPSGPREGSFTSIRAAPPASAASASAAERTLTRSSAMRPPRGHTVDGKEPHPAGVRAERQDRQVLEGEAVQHGALEPGRVVKVAAPVGTELLRGAVRPAIGQVAGPDDAADRLGGPAEDRRPGGPRSGPR